VSKNNKQPKWAKQPAAKQAKGLEAGEATNNAMRFSWRCNWIDLDGEWGFRAIDCERLWREVVPRLHDLESMTWGEIYGRRDGSTHPMPTANIETSAKVRLTDIGRSDYDSLFQINVRGGIRLWGIRDRAFFYLLWFDPRHTVYIQK